MSFAFTVNGAPVELEAPGMRRLLDVLREDLGLTGTKEGCGEGECGACSVLLDGEVVDAAWCRSARSTGASVRRSRGSRRTGRLGHAAAGVPGDRRRAVRHLHAGDADGRRRRSSSPAAAPTDEDIREAIAGNLCRCTGYTKIIEAIALAAERRSAT